MKKRYNIMANILTWNFPMKKVFLLKIETLLIAILAVLVFFATFLRYERWYLAVIFTVLFLGIYLIISALIQKHRKVKEKYKLSSSHLEITRSSRSKIKKVIVPIKDIKHHKLDKFFLGGYILTHSKDRHPLFFNTRQEVVKFENFLLKHLRKRKTSTTVKKKTSKVKSKRVAKKSVKKKIVKRKVVKRTAKKKPIKRKVAKKATPKRKATKRTTKKRKR